MVAVRFDHRSSAPRRSTLTCSPWTRLGSGARPSGCSYADLGRQEQDAPEDATTCGRASRCIPAHGPRDVPQSGEKSGADRARASAFAVICETTQLNNAVQDTER
jgi:hypothetical protein